jgi:sec-independent protein translocase protein TatA
MRIGQWEILIILAVVLLLFGPKRLPDLGRSIGRTIREFRHATSEKSEGDESDKTSPDAKSKG